MCETKKHRFQRHVEKKKERQIVTVPSGLSLRADVSVGGSCINTESVATKKKSEPSAASAPQQARKNENPGGTAE